MQLYRAFTREYDKKKRCLLTDVELIVDRQKFKAKALWDTGATNSCISKDIAKRLNLTTTSFVSLQTASGERYASQHMINVILPNNLLVPNIVVSEIEAQGFELLIGMDIISVGDFAISNYGGKSLFTFRFPSFESLDFERQLQEG